MRRGGASMRQHAKTSRDTEETLQYSKIDLWEFQRIPKAGLPLLLDIKQGVYQQSVAGKKH